MIKLRLNARASFQLNEILTFVALNSGMRAHDLVDKGFEDAFSIMETFPFHGQLAGPGSNIRRSFGVRHARRYAIYYSVSNDIIDVLAILDGAQDAPRHLGGLEFTTDDEA